MSPPSRTAAAPRRPVLAAGAAGRDVTKGLQRLLRAQVDALFLHARPAGAGNDPEALHQTRIAIRKLRALLRAFRQRLKSTRARELDRELQRLNRSLGRVRDTDVWLARLQQDTGPARLVRTRPWQALVASHQARRRRQQPVLRRLLGPGARASLRRRLTRLVERELPRAARQARRRTLGEAARRILRRHLRRVCKMAIAGAEAPLAEQHRRRIALRRLRYLAAFFAPLFGPEIGRLQRRTHAADRALGELRDAALALETLAQTGPIKTRPAAATGGAAALECRESVAGRVTTLSLRSPAATGSEKSSRKGPKRIDRVPPRKLLAHLRAVHRQAQAAWARAWKQWRDPTFQRAVRRALRR